MANEADRVAAKYPPPRKGEYIWPLAAMAVFVPVHLIWDVFSWNVLLGMGIVLAFYVLVDLRNLYLRRLAREHDEIAR